MSFTHTTYRTLVVEQNAEGAYIASVQEKSTEDLPAGQVLVKVSYSSVNYKDALSSIGNKGVSKFYPHTPGIDAAGYIEYSHVDEWKVGEAVIVTGYDLGMNHWGGHAEYISVPADWLVSCPTELSLDHAMIWGTAGLTAALSVEALLDHYSYTKTQPTLPIVVTGATGGVGALAVGILAHLGYDVVAVSGKGDIAKKLLTDTLGAKEVITREELLAHNEKPLARPAFGGGIDAVGGDALSSILKATAYAGMVTCCGLVASPALDVNVFPFILRGVRLAGIDSVQIPHEKRKHLWQLMAKDWKFSALEMVAHYCSLAELPNVYDDILHGKMVGRMVVEVQK